MQPSHMHIQSNFRITTLLAERTDVDAKAVLGLDVIAYAVLIGGDKATICTLKRMAVHLQNSTLD